MSRWNIESCDLYCTFEMYMVWEWKSLRPSLF